MDRYTILSTVNIILSITALLGNSLILVALHKESSLQSPSKLLYRCLATTDLLVGFVCQPLHATLWMSVVREHRSLCRYLGYANYISYALCGVSLLTMTAICVDRLFALLLGLRYKQIVTLKRTYIIVVTFWVFSPFWTSLNAIFDHRILYLCTGIFILLCLIISLASYTKIFCTLRHHHTQVHGNVQQQPSQPSALNMARYRKAVHSTLWVQLALIVCYAPFFIVLLLAIVHNGISSSHLFVILQITIVLVYFNSTLNPFLYCWKISEVRLAVKQTIRQTKYHHTQVHDHVQYPPSQPNALNMARYRKAVHSALWVQLALIVCYAPSSTVSLLAIVHNVISSSHLFAIKEITTVLVYFNSTLNPFLYCWKISEV
ncbi:melanocyte-stimulating hormone receptor-like, partial [Stylophora pistillata]|uniref:melanocyte-stimulating hormone receptor-like n=1 Tax=Stylophora pistillata TaxID=50429 RepID=UPI000C0505C7